MENISRAIYRTAVIRKGISGFRVSHHRQETKETFKSKQRAGSSWKEKEKRIIRLIIYGSLR